jgi:hypothetical protein
MRSELSDQLQSAARRRAELVQELSSTTGFAREGLEARVRILDERIASIEQQIAVSGRELAGTIATAGSAQPPGPIPGLSEEAFSVLTGLGIIFVLAPIAFALARVLWRSARVPAPPRSGATDSRLERIEQAVDAIAIEVERISEAQRYSAKLLSQGPASPINRPESADPAAIPGYLVERGGSS